MGRRRDSHRPAGGNEAGTEAAAKIELLDRAAALAGDYLAGERDGWVVPSGDETERIRSLVGAVELDEPIGADAALDLVGEAGRLGAARTTGGRYFGFVNGGVTPIGLASSVLAAAWDQNVALPVMSPAGALIDEAAARLVVEALGLPPSSVAAFCAGATIANLTAIVAARDALLHRAGWDLTARGLRGAPAIAVVASAESHSSVFKALRVAGFGRDHVHIVPTDEAGRLIPSELPARRGPTLVLVQAGNVNTGGSDPFDEVVDRLGSDETWVHVDGAFGLWAAASPSRRHLVAGVERADSWATDAHKWLNAPYDCGVVISRDGDALARAMTMDAAYASGSEHERAPMNLGLQMSQGARAVPVWAMLAAEGRAGVAAIVDRTCDLAARFADRLASAGVDVLAPVVLNQVLVGFGDDERTAAVIERVKASGVCWMGGTTWQGRTAMRISVSDASTTAADVDRSVEAILGAWRTTGAD